MAVDGDDAAKEKAKGIVSSLGSIPFYVPAKDRALYHAAACFCSNYAVTVLSVAQTLMSRWTETENDASKALLPLVRGTMENVSRNSLWGHALTGPISRGDLGTVKKHLSVLSGDLLPMYKALGMETAKLALDNGTIDKDTYRRLIQLLAKAEGDHQDEKSD